MEIFIFPLSFWVFFFFFAQMEVLFAHNSHLVAYSVTDMAENIYLCSIVWYYSKFVKKLTKHKKYTGYAYHFSTVVQYSVQVF